MSEDDALRAEWESLICGYDTQTGAEQLSASDAIQLHKEGKLFVIDTRNESEYKYACIQNARLLPPTTLGMAMCLMVGSGMRYDRDVDGLLPDLAAVPEHATIVCSCTAGLRSGFSAVDLSKKTGRTVKNLHGGIIEWFNHGGVVVCPETGKEVDKIHTYGAKWSKYVKDGKGWY